MDDDYRKRSESASRASFLADRMFERRCSNLRVPATDVERAMGAIFEADATLTAATSKASQQ